MKYAVRQVFRTVNAGSKQIEMFRFEPTELNCEDMSLWSIGSEVTVVRGRKIPKGTKVVIERAIEDGYGRSYHSYWSGRLFNPAVLVRLPDGSKTWTIAKNLEVAPEDISAKEVFEAESFNKALSYVAGKYKSKTGTVYCFSDDKHSTIYDYSFEMLDAGTCVYSDCGKKYLADCGDTWAMVQDDWRSDTYQFLAFTKEPKLNNCTGYVSKGQPKRWDDNGGDTGIGAAIEAFEAYVKEHNGVMVA